MTPPPAAHGERPPRAPLSAARRYSRPGHQQPDVPSDAVAQADPTNAPPNGSQVFPPRTARVLGIVAIALWFFPCTLGVQRLDRAGRTQPAEGRRTRWLDEAIVFLTYRPG